LPVCPQDARPSNAMAPIIKNKFFILRVFGLILCQSY
jgi:hypothetical protein